MVHKIKFFKIGLLLLLVNLFITGCADNYTGKSGYKTTTSPIQTEVVTQKVYADVEIPDVTGVNKAEAENTLNNISKDFNIIYEYAKSDTYGIDDVIEMEILENSGKENASIKLIVCNAVPKKIPENIYDCNLEEAEKILKELNLDYIVEEKYSETIEEGKVVNCSPSKYYEGVENTKFYLTISKGKDDRIFIPTYIGEDIEKASKILSEKGFNVEIKYAYKDISSYDCYYGNEYTRVDDQSFKGYTKDKNQKVVLTVNKAGIILTGVRFSMNYVGGIDTSFSFKNLSDKQIKYITFKCTYFDRVGEKAYCTVRGECDAKMRFTGPLNAGESSSADFSAVIYNYTIAAVKPDEIFVEYTDGTNQNLKCDGRYWYHNDFYGGKLNY